MAFGTQDDADEVMNEINMTPLVDVMLVLLIIFIITVPVMKHSVNVDLPRATNQPEIIKPETVRLSVAADGSISGTARRCRRRTLLPPAGRRGQGRPSPTCTSGRQGSALRARGPGHGGGAACGRAQDRLCDRAA
jgi:biopolymer transport protein ExbD